MTLPMRKTRYFRDSEERLERAEKAAAMALRNYYNNPKTQGKIPADLIPATVDLITADEILEKARKEMVDAHEKRRK